MRIRYIIPYLYRVPFLCLGKMPIKAVQCPSEMTAMQMEHNTNIIVSVGYFQRLPLFQLTAPEEHWY